MSLTPKDFKHMKRVPQVKVIRRALGVTTAVPNRRDRPNPSACCS